MVSRYAPNGPLKQDNICLIGPPHYRVLPPSKFFFFFSTYRTFILLCILIFYKIQPHVCNSLKNSRCHAVIVFSIKNQYFTEVISVIGLALCRTLSLHYSFLSCSVFCPCSLFPLFQGSKRSTRSSLVADAINSIFVLSLLSCSSPRL